MNIPQNTLSAFLQTLALVENVRTDFGSMADFARSHNSDVRRCVVNLQYSVLSGGAPETTLRSLPPVLSDNGPQAVVAPEQEDSKNSVISSSTVVENKSKSNDDDDDDFVTLKPFKKRRHFLEDDHSNFGDCVSVIDVPKAVNETNSVVSSLEDLSNNPLVHFIGHSELTKILTQRVKLQSSDSILQMISARQSAKSTALFHVLHDNIHLLLPLKYQVVATISSKATDVCKIPPQRKRIRLHSDLYDSEESNDTGAVKAVCNNVEPVIDQENTIPNTEPVAPVDGQSKHENICLGKSLSLFSRFYEDVSFLDMMESVESQQVCDRLQSMAGRQLQGSLIAGMENSLPGHVVKNDCDLDVCRNYSSEIGTRSACHMYNSVFKLQEQVEEISVKNPVYSENFSLPVQKNQEKFTRFDQSEIR